MTVTLVRAAEKPTRTLTLGAAALGFFVLTLDTQIVSVAMPVIGHDLRGGISALQWVVTGYTLMLAALLLSAGALSDRVGASRAFGGGLAAFTVASAVCGLAPSLGVLVAARFAQGAAAAAILPASLALVRQAYPDAAERVRAIAVWTATGGAAMAAGPLVGGLLTSTFGWRSAFYVNAPIGIAGLLAMARTPRSAARPVPFDLPGQLSAVVGMAAVTYAVIQRSIVALVVFVVAAGVFAYAERRARHPMVPLGLFRQPGVVVAVGVGLAVNFAFYGVVFLLALYFEQVRGLPALLAGLMFLPMTALITVVNLTAGRLVNRYGPRLPMVVGQVVLAAGVLGLLLLGRDTPVVVQALLLVPFGVGGGLTVPALTVVLLRSVDAGQAGIASGILNAGRQFGGALGVAVFGALAAGGLLAGMRIALLVAVVALAVTVVSSLRDSAAG
ncbi:MFS transporter [Fodinicola acaciae]|uniref:MFS transporter n=1 Tax=Fodinicola acaciae TaxID=2681555 RepID=UPI0013D1201D|nr:MFS transporter [Fodinicola acaciae]